MTRIGRIHTLACGLTGGKSLKKSCEIRAIREQRFL
jgi:hypothetical protein